MKKRLSGLAFCLAFIMTSAFFTPSAIAAEDASIEKLQSCVRWWYKDWKLKENFRMSHWDEEEHLTNKKRYHGYRFTAEKGVEYLFVACGQKSLKDYAILVNDTNQKNKLIGVKPAQKLSSVMVSALLWTPPASGKYFVGVGLAKKADADGYYSFVMLVK